MTTLENKILEAQDAYYNGTPIMNDIEFDALWEQLKKEQPDSEILQAVGADHTDGFAKVDHMIIMGSQNKAKNVEELNEWYIFNAIDPDTIAQYKMDGISLELTYKNGKLQKAVTRGDGCLDYDTILQTDKGPLKIGDIVEHKIKCSVLAKNLETDKIIYTPITNWFINKNDSEWYELKTESGKTIKVTGNHLVWLPKKGVFRQVQDLVEGDEFDIVD